MFIDARKMDRKEIKSDVCIVGAGAAGITLARALADDGIHICLLESGGLEPDQDTQSLYQGESAGVPYYPLDACRIRYFGGTTAHWGGCCWPLEEREFEQREWVPYSGWPFARKELDPYYIKAQEACEVGPFNYDAEYWSEKGDEPLLPFANGRVTTKIYQNGSPPTRFGKRYREEIDKADNVSAILYASVTDIELDHIDQAVRSVQAATLEGQRVSVTARFFVIAAGGLENTRLLLLNEIGNQNDLVGRFFMEHIMLPASTLLIPKSIDTDFYIRSSIGGTDIRAGLSLQPHVLEKEEILNSWSGFDLKPTAGLRLVSSWDKIKTSLLNGEIPDRLKPTIKRMLRDMRQLYGEMMESDDELLTIPVRNHSEQAPNPSSRVTLSDQLDELGQRKIRLDWRLTELDYRSIRRAQEIIAAEVGQNNIGRMKILTPEQEDVWEDPKRISDSATPSGSFHHMGTTRMHKNHKLGVVDEDCRVHETKNLYVAGSSVFPTCGYTNPTLTIVAMAYRMADHLRSQMAPQTV